MHSFKHISFTCKPEEKENKIAEILKNNPGFYLATTTTRHTVAGQWKKYSIMILRKGVN